VPDPDKSDRWPSRHRALMSAIASRELDEVIEGEKLAPINDLM
jgi:hypothetical protein